ncbi:hypothetical protein BKA65DRAFT_487777 [Rhexocercosporidium sp. MPI-PUGE-AT-0058]|nr:hypothetical protein BKA65DRAFT_487777 [Rhexocercosporidium sp. MPI-PUGE-AT-0058]
MVDDAPDEDWVQGSDVQYNDNNGRIPRSCTTSEIHASTHTKDDRRRGARPHQRPHYAIEKRYRANINSNFEELRQCLVDARSFLDLESTSERGSGSSSSEYSRSDEQQQEAMKMSKTKVLSEAVDYIHFLEALNDRATEHIQLLENQLGVCQKESLR